MAPSGEDHSDLEAKGTRPWTTRRLRRRAPETAFGKLQALAAGTAIVRSGLTREWLDLGAQCERRRSEEEDSVATIPRVLHEHINSAFPTHVCLVATVLPNGFGR